MILAVGTFAQLGFGSIGFGVAVLAPVFRARFGLGLTEVGLLIAAPNLGSIATVFLWGILVDRVGERLVTTLSLALAAVALTAAAMRTERIRLGTDLTPLSRMRPWKLARRDRKSVV